MTCLPVQNLDASGVLTMVLADRSGSIGTFAGSVALRVVRTPVLAIANAISIAVGTMRNAISIAITLVNPVLLTTILIRGVIYNTTCEQRAGNA